MDIAVNKNDAKCKTKQQALLKRAFSPYVST
jgi:hypothetical protein